MLLVPVGVCCRCRSFNDGLMWWMQEARAGARQRTGVVGAWEEDESSGVVSGRQAGEGGSRTGGWRLELGWTAGGGLVWFGLVWLTRRSPPLAPRAPALRRPGPWTGGGGSQARPPELARSAGGAFGQAMGSVSQMGASQPPSTATEAVPVSERAAESVAALGSWMDGDQTTFVVGIPAASSSNSHTLPRTALDAVPASSCEGFGSRRWGQRVPVSVTERERDPSPMR